jgi:uncharacterized protein YyaL (SSP411 family)
MPTNRLADEKSPYLLQHAHNPVDWYPWGAEAFDKSRAEDKPIFLSIGYSTCHWCHVMERESFENDQIAAILNRDYVAIKVDREERPDVDSIYMTFVQATTGGGGWPMSVWLTPDLEPFFGGTYFPPENRWGNPGFGAVLEQIAAAWRSDRGKIAASARDVVAQLRRQAAVEPPEAAPSAPDAAMLDNGFAAFRRTFDPQSGGFGNAPKFPRPAVFNFLFRYHARTGNREALEMALATLGEMAKGGMCDQLGGGFHRYSVDQRWFVPHFEKMLYDQAQLAISYLEAFQIAGERQYADTARGIFEYVLRDMRDPAGGFYSAEDADSAIDPAEPTVKGEGAFYLWQAEEIRDLVEAPVAGWFCHRYGAAEGGNVASDPHGEFTGRNILYQAASVEETAEQFGRPAAEVRAGLEKAAAALLEARSKRLRPHLDDKVLTSWNGLMISALARGGAVLGEPRYAAAARAAAEFALSTLFDPGTGALLRRYRQGEAAIPGFLDDYALLTQALLDMYESQFDLRHLRAAIRLTERQIELFEDREHGGFFSSAAGDGSLVMRLKEDYDGAEPSGNSVAVRNLLRLAGIANRADFREAAMKTLGAFRSRLSAVPAALPEMLAACEFLLGDPRQIVLVGEPGTADFAALLGALHARFLPNHILLRVDSEEARAFLAAGIPAIESMRQPGAYVCRGNTCQLPVLEAGGFAELIQ